MTQIKDLHTPNFSRCKFIFKVSTPEHIVMCEDAYIPLDIYADTLNDAYSKLDKALEEAGLAFVIVIEHQCYNKIERKSSWTSP